MRILLLSLTLLLCACGSNKYMLVKTSKGELVREWETTGRDDCEFSVRKGQKQFQQEGQEADCKSNSQGQHFPFRFTLQMPKNKLTGYAMDYQQCRAWMQNIRGYFDQTRIGGQVSECEKNPDFRK